MTPDVQLPRRTKPVEADPAPLGLAAFAAPTLMLGIVNTGLVASPAIEAVLPLGLCFGGLGLLTAGNWEFRRGNTFAGTAFTTYGAFWLALVLYFWIFAVRTPRAEVHNAIGLFLLVFTIITGYLMVASWRTTTAVAMVFVPLFASFLALCIGAFSRTEWATQAGGWLGVVAAAAGFYASAAGVIEATWMSAAREGAVDDVALSAAAGARRSS
ncbi:acetate uptake transporter [Streptomyces sp. NPDC004393]